MKEPGSISQMAVFWRTVSSSTIHDTMILILKKQKLGLLSGNLTMTVRSHSSVYRTYI